MPYLIDPRAGDAEDDASSTKKRRLMSIAGSMLVELSPAKFLLAWTLVVAVPALAIGMIPPLASAWLSKISERALAFSGLGSALVIALLVAIAWFGLRPFLRFAESSFWSLNSMAVQPCYALAREGLRHLAERTFFAKATETARARSRGAMSIVAGIMCATVGFLVIVIAWPYTRWNASVFDFINPVDWIAPAVANAAIIITAYFSSASLVWAASDAIMDQPARFTSFVNSGDEHGRYRIAHLSDLHAVGEQYGFRIESGRSGPQGNGRIADLFDELDRIDQIEPLDLILITGDMTDAGRSSEWAVFLDALDRRPSLRERALILPGNHDVNIVDRTNPARLELPLSPQKRLRQFRMLSAMEHVQGSRVHVFDRKTREIGETLSLALAPYRSDIDALADERSLSLACKLAPLWADCFPLIMPPRTNDGVGVIILNSNSASNFSFTNALGLVTTEDVRALCDVVAQNPDSRWIIALHHHLVEYPMLAKSFSERIGTSLINGSWFVRQLESYADRIVIMHGHRHIDWIGCCGPLKILSAPSPVMEALNHQPTSFLVHSITRTVNGGIGLCEPERFVVPGARATEAQTPNSDNVTEGVSA